MWFVEDAEEMSWFSDLTDKAGALLNKVDQVAASSLQEVGIASPSTKVPVSSSSGYEVIPPSSWANQRERGVTVAQVLVGSASESPLITPKSKHYKPASPLSPTPSSSGHSHSHFGSTHSVPISSSSSTSNQQVTEDSLFEFLNSPKLTGSSGSKNFTSSRAIMTPVHTEVKMPRPRSSPMLAQSSLKKDVEHKEAGRSEYTKPDMEQEGEQEGKVKSEMIVTKGTEGKHEKEKKEDKEKQAVIVVEEIDLHEIDDHTLASSPLEPEREHEVEVNINKEARPSSSADSESATAAELEKWKQTVSNLELENKLMKREVISLNEELGGVMTRLNEASQSVVHYQSEIHALREQSSQSDHMIRQLRSHDEDLQAAVEVRDSQLQVLRTQLSLADKAVEEHKEQFVLAKKEQERLVYKVDTYCMLGVLARH